MSELQLDHVPSETLSFIKQLPCFDDLGELYLSVLVSLNFGVDVLIYFKFLDEIKVYLYSN